ncbi:MFS transporter [Lentzea sp. NPDC051838]|uniref:MFS transporter n=1 Tax=Lentzea sp. NPDC051838 TaxID=3154849 RepID=UPI00342183D7
MAVSVVEGVRLPVLTGALMATVAVASFVTTATAALMPAITTDIGGRSVYALAFAVFTLAELVALVAGARVCDTLGPVRSFLGGATAHVLGLVLAGVAGDFGWFLVGRFVQGVGSGLVTVSVYVLVAQCYSEQQRTGMFAAMASAWAVPGLLGPVAGGLMSAAWTWRSVFLSVPVVELAALVVVLPTLLVVQRTSVRRESVEPVAVRLLAALVLAAGVVAVSCLRLFPESWTWPVLAGALLAIAFGVRPLVPAGTFRFARGLPTGILLRGFVGGFFSGAQYLLPLALSEGRGYSAVGAGLALSCGVVGFSLGGLLQSRQQLTRIPVSTRMAVSLAALAAGMLITALGLDPDLPVVLAYAGWLVAGLGLGVAITGLNLFVLETAPEHERGAASAAMRITDSIGNALMVAAGGLVIATTAVTGPSTARAAEWVTIVFALGMAATATLARRLRGAS